MTWVRIDDGFVEHPKIGALTDKEFRVWMRLLCYCGRQEDPTVDRITRRNVSGLTDRFVSKLVQLSLLDSIKNAYEVHDWEHYRPRDETGAERQARWRSRRQEQAKDPRYATVTNTVTESVTKGVTKGRYANRYASVTPEPEPEPDPSEGSSVNEAQAVNKTSDDNGPDSDIDFTNIILTKHL